MHVFATGLEGNSPFARTPSASTEVAPERIFEGLRSLVVEDNFVNQMVLQAILEGLGCQVSVASDGLAGLEISSTSTFDIILMDINMPVMSGLEAASKIRTHSKLPIIGVSANVLAENIRACFECGMNGFLPKPVSRHSVVVEICRILDRTLPNGLI